MVAWTNYVLHLGMSNPTLSTMIATPLDVIFERYRALRLVGKSPENNRLYRVSLNNLSRYLGTTPTTEHLTDDTLTAFAGWRISVEEVTPATANSDLNRLLALWRFAARKGYVTQWPDVDLLDEPKTVPKAWMKPELQQLLRACRAQREDMCGVPAGLWWTAIHSVAYDTGERIAALLGVRWEDLSGQHLYFPASIRKGKRVERMYELHPTTLGILQQISTPPRKLIFPLPFCLGTLYSRYTELLASAGLPTDRRSKFHRLRRTAGSFCAAAGGDAQEFLGHSDRKTTSRYLDPRLVKPNSIVRKMWRPSS